jgi:GT2 family glycosyltransferase
LPARVSVVIPNYNGRHLIGPCLEALRRQTYGDFETIVVDDGSTDGSVDLVKEAYPEVRLVALRENGGFSAAVNAGIRASRTEHVALLNNDAEPEAGWISALLRAADSHPEAALFASKLVSASDRRILDGAGDALRWSGLPMRLGHGEKDRGQYDEGGYVFGACAAAAMYRRGLFEEIGPFDEDFFAYCEDADLSFRALLAGHGCLYVPEAVVHHAGSASFGRRSPFALRQGTQNGVGLLVKNVPAGLLLRYSPLFVVGQLLRVVLTSTSRGGAKANLSGLLGAARLLPRTLAKRREIQRRRKVSSARVEEVMLRSFGQAARSRARSLRDGLLGG